MTTLNGFAKLLMRAMTVLAVTPCFGSFIGAPDTNCNTSVDPPASGGSTGYNFYGFVDGSTTGGSSFQNYYVAAGDPPRTLTLTGNAYFRVLDGGHQGDTFQVFDNNVLLGTTSATPIDANHSGANDPTGAGTDPAACWNDPLMSRGTFPLTPGAQSINVSWDQRVPGGNSTLQWFELNTNQVAAPGALLLAGFGLIATAGPPLVMLVVRESV